MFVSLNAFLCADFIKFLWIQKKIPQFQIFEIYQIMAILWVKLENCEKMYFFDEGSIFFFFFLV